MDIYTALKNFNLRVEGGGKWACMSEEGLWIVYQHLYGKKNVQILVETTNEEEAMRHLTEDL